MPETKRPDAWTIPITGDYLAGIFTDPKFFEYLKESRKIALSGFESNFKVYMIEDRSYRLGHFEMGDDTSCANHVPIIRGYEGGSFDPRVAWFHSHPKGPIFPSDGDLKSAGDIAFHTYLKNEPNNSLVRTMSILYPVFSEDGDYPLLIFQARRPVYPEEVEDFWGEFADWADNTQAGGAEIAERLNETELFRSRFLRVGKEGPQKEELEMIKDFAFEITVKPDYMEEDDEGGTA